MKLVAALGSRLSVLLISLLLGFLLPWVSAANDAEQAPEAGPAPIALLGQMSKALSELEYEGTLVYLNGHELSTLRIAHRINGGQAHESLLALSGPVRAVARSRQTVTCVLPDARAISVPRHSAHAATLHSGTLDAERLRPHYLIHHLGQSRVAGRDTLVVGIIPKDDLRYGYRFFVDKDTGLPLKTDLMDSSATPIEQVMFTEIEFLGRASADAMAANAAPLQPLEAAVSVNSGLAHSAPASAPIDLAPWSFSELPAGYAVVAGDPPATDTKGTKGQRRWFMVSDGLSVVSVYIEPDQGYGLAGHKRIGAMNAAGRSLNGYQITAVGEAPLQTVQAIAAAVRTQP
ncbi:MucB/RseB C-terminal domain-containing protein [Halochromatium roseum]|uniref:MucB/RseB C-terminal domain-containing protein n=1 Tax=Halochromatium roseum TaxID=391920 RepID=UPI001913C5F7|nr:MucB/RseB C-terminal domain-containing protein [Halochromatium roseum]